MPKYELKLDERRRITLPEFITNGMGKELNISPNTVTALLYSKNVPLEDIIRSAKLLLDMLEHERDMAQNRKREAGEVTLGA